MTKTLKSVAAGLFAASILIWAAALLALHPVYTVVAVIAAGATFVLSARHQARSSGRKQAAALASRAEQAHTQN